MTTNQALGRITMKTVALTLLVLLAGCDSAEPVKTESADNSERQIDTLFDYDGCRVYRFVDHMEYIYFARCGSDGRVSWQEPHTRYNPTTKTTETYNVPRQTVFVR